VAVPESTRPPRRVRRWSLLLGAVAAVVAVLALLGPPYNGLSLLAVLLLVLSIARRVFEYSRDSGR